MEDVNNIKFLTEEEINELDFYEAALYLQTLNQIKEKCYKENTNE